MCQGVQPSGLCMFWRRRKCLNVFLKIARRPQEVTKICSVGNMVFIIVCLGSFLNKDITSIILVKYSMLPMSPPYWPWTRNLRTCFLKGFITDLQGGGGRPKTTWLPFQWYQFFFRSVDCIVNDPCRSCKFLHFYDSTNKW